MVERREGANLHKDVGKWRHVEKTLPYETWEKDLPDGGKAQVLVGDTGRDAPDDYWAHVEYKAGPGGWEWSEERLPAGDSRKKVVEATVEWMRRNQDWRPAGPDTESGLSLGLEGGGGHGGFF